MYLCGWGLLCLEPLIFQQLQMRVPDFQPSKTPGHKCACCKSLAEELSEDEVMSILDLRWQLISYFHPLRTESEDVSKRNIFWSTADALHNNHARTINLAQAMPIIIQCLENEFNFAAWPCPVNLADTACTLGDVFEKHTSAPLGFEAIGEQKCVEVPDRAGPSNIHERSAAAASSSASAASPSADTEHHIWPPKTHECSPPAAAAAGYSAEPSTDIAHQDIPGAACSRSTGTGPERWIECFRLMKVIDRMADSAGIHEEQGGDSKACLASESIGDVLGELSPGVLEGFKQLLDKKAAEQHRAALMSKFGSDRQAAICAVLEDVAGTINNCGSMQSPRTDHEPSQQQNPRQLLHDTGHEALQAVPSKPFKKEVRSACGQEAAVRDGTSGEVRAAIRAEAAAAALLLEEEQEHEAKLQKAKKAAAKRAKLQRKKAKSGAPALQAAQQQTPGESDHLMSA